ncbi:MAG TPA: hypothetical protein PLT74_12810, partial [Kiritimatiellia bacterium]|nr:hypothetical protein [Kiritimatiellia bacterium]
FFALCLSWTVGQFVGVTTTPPLPNVYVPSERKQSKSTASSIVRFRAQTAKQCLLLQEGAPAVAESALSANGSINVSGASCGLMKRITGTLIECITNAKALVVVSAARHMIDAHPAISNNNAYLIMLHITKTPSLSINTRDAAYHIAVVASLQVPTRHSNPTDSPGRILVSRARIKRLMPPIGNRSG